MKSTQNLNFVKFAACMVLVVGLSASALASCGDTLSAMAAAAASAQSQFRPIQPNSKSGEDNDGKSAIVGLWHIQFTAGGQTIQEAYQLWNAGGTRFTIRMLIREEGTSAWECGSALHTGLSSSLTECGRTTRTETSWGPSTSVKPSLWDKAVKRTAVLSRWISTTLPATSNSR